MASFISLHPSLDPFQRQELTLEASDELLKLTHLERIGPKGWLRYIFPFELSHDYSIQEVSRVLRAGYHAAAERLSVMACEAIPDTEAKQAGQLKLKKISEDTELLVIKDLRAEGVFPLTFAELKAKSFPVSALPASTLCPGSVWAQPGQRLPISLVQANFIPGGLILAWNLFHMFGDSITYSIWSEVWAEECRRAQGLDILDPVELPEQIFTDRARVMKPSRDGAVKAEDHPEYISLPFTPQGMPPKMVSDTHRGQVFYFSPESLAALKAEASPDNASKAPQAATSDSTSPQWISTNDAVSALLWRTVMAAQNPIASLDALAESETDPMSTFAIAIDGRTRTDPPVHPRTLGCFLEYVGVEMPIRKILTGPLADVAVEIRKAVAKVGKTYTDEVVNIVDGLEDLDRLIVKAFTDVPGYNCVQTSWTNFKVYDLNWGPTLGNKIQSMRCPDVGVINGCQVVFPTTPDGGLEVLIGVEQSCLDKLMHEPMWTRFADAR